MQPDHKFLTKHGMIKQDVYARLRQHVLSNDDSDCDQLYADLVEIATVKNEHVPLLSFFVDIICQHVLTRDIKLLSFLYERIRTLSMMPKRKIAEINEYQIMMSELCYVVYVTPKKSTRVHEHVDINVIDTLVHNYGDDYYDAPRFNTGSSLQKLLNALWNRIVHKDKDHVTILITYLVHYKGPVDELLTTYNDAFSLSVKRDTIWYVWELILSYVRKYRAEYLEFIDKYVWIFSFQYTRKKRSDRVHLLLYICLLIIKDNNVLLKERFKENKLHKYIKPFQKYFKDVNGCLPRSLGLHTVAKEDGNGKSSKLKVQQSHKIKSLDYLKVVVNQE